MSDYNLINYNNSHDFIILLWWYCCPQYDVKLMWRHRGNDIVSVAAICAAAQLIFLFGRTRLAV